PGTDPELIYTIFTTLLGVGVFGYVIGSMASLLANIDPARVRHQEAVERVKAFMKYRQIPFGLQTRVLDYYEYLWEKRLGYDELLAVSTLPPSLKTEVSLFLNREIIQKVPLFRTASEEFIRAIALEMQPVIFLPGDYILRAGDSGEEMFFISQGAVEVVSADEQVVYATLAPGQFFGEMALILDQPRTASVRAVDYCDLYMLRKSSLERILLRHPAIAATITDIAKQRQEENIRRTQKGN
ncbi:MAG: cyclic nucleotide-binding domain-containing protein, partial [Acidobacteria bacterium]|nr:cyclic nucleotide-binding domain-containing protein [Acidobacteriota bacterium]